MTRRQVLRLVKWKHLCVSAMGVGLLMIRGPVLFHSFVVYILSFRPCRSLSVSAGEGGRGFRARRRLLPQRRVPRPPRLPPLRPVTNLSFSRSFTFSFFELPLHQSPRCRAERIRNLMLLLRQIHYWSQCCVDSCIFLFIGHRHFSKCSVSLY